MQVSKTHYKLKTYYLNIYYTPPSKLLNIKEQKDIIIIAE